MSADRAKIESVASVATELLHRLKGISEWITRHADDPDPIANWPAIVTDSERSRWIADALDTLRTLTGEARAEFNEAESALRTASGDHCWTARAIGMAERFITLAELLGWFDPAKRERHDAATHVAAALVTALLEERTHGGSPVVTLAREIQDIDAAAWLDGIRNEATRATPAAPVPNRTVTEPRWSKFMTPQQWRRTFAQMEGRRIGRVSASTWQRRRDAYRRHPDSTRRSVAFDLRHFEGFPYIEEITPTAGEPTETIRNRSQSVQ